MGKFLPALPKVQRAMLLLACFHKDTLAMPCCHIWNW